MVPEQRALITTEKNTNAEHVDWTDGELQYPIDSASIWRKQNLQWQSSDEELPLKGYFYSDITKVVE